MIFPCAVISTTAQTNARDVPLISPIKEFPSPGSATLSISGKMILRNVWKYVIPIALAASICPTLTDAKAPRKISAIYADSLKKLAVAVNKSLIDSRKSAIGIIKSAIEQKKYNELLKADIMVYDEIKKNQIFGTKEYLITYHPQKEQSWQNLEI